MARIPIPEKQRSYKTNGQVHCVSWTLTAARGSEQLREHINMAWGLRTWDPGHFAYALGRTNDIAKPLWDRIFQRDDVEMARRCLASGWGPPTRTVEYANHFLWQAALMGAWNMVEWFRSSPHFKKEMDDCAKAEPDQWWKCATSVVSMERLRNIGVVFQQVDKNGNTVAHQVMKRYGIKPSIVDWFFEHYPELLTQRNMAQVCPLDLCSPQLAAHAQSKLLQRSSAATTHRKTSPRL